MARAQAVETATAKQYQEDSAGKGNELHWPVGFPPFPVCAAWEVQK